MAKRVNLEDEKVRYGRSLVASLPSEKLKAIRPVDESRLRVASPVRTLERPAIRQAESIPDPLAFVPEIKKSLPAR